MEFDPPDLTILYTEDTVQWCEYLFDIFKDFEIQQNSEDITNFPTHQTVLQGIKDSLVTVVIISPVFLQKCTPRMQDYLHQVVGLICGVDDADMEELMEKIPSARDWHPVDAVAGSGEISKVVLKVLHDASDEKEKLKAVTDDTYIEMVGGPTDDDRPENTYFYPPGVPDPPGVPEETYEAMAPIQQMRKPPVAPIGSHVFQPTSQGYVDMKEAKHLSQCSPGLTIQPHTARSGKEEELFILFQDPAISMKVQDQYTVSFQGKLKKSEVIAHQKNPYTLQVDLPKDHPAELTDVQVTGLNRAVIGTFKFIFTSLMDDLSRILRDLDCPLEFMCQSLGVSPADANELDNVLYKHIQRCIPAGGLNLLVGQVGGEQKVISELPTALHFAARFGLKNICSMLISCPGAVQAMKLKNSHGLTPDVMAGNNGHHDLKSFLENFVEVAEDEGIAPESGPTSSYMFMKTGLYAYYNQEALKKLHERHQGPDYDSPFQVPIPATGISFTRDETIKKLVQGKQEDIEEYYGSLNLDMVSFERDQDGEEDYEQVEDQFGHRQQSTKRPSARRPPPRQPSDERPIPVDPAAPAVVPRQSSASEPESDTAEKPLPKKNVKVVDILGLQPLASGQQHLIEIQNRVKNKEVTVDEAVMLFKNWEQLQETNRLSFSTQSATFSALKKQQQQVKEKRGGLFGKKQPKKGAFAEQRIGKSIFYSRRSPCVANVAASAAVTCSQALGKESKPGKKGRAQSEPIIISHYGQQPMPLPAQKPQERIIQSEVSVQNRPTSTTSLDSHGSRDSSYHSSTDEPDQERYYPSHPVSSTGPPALRKRPDPSKPPMTQQDRIKRLSSVDVLPNYSQRPVPPVPSRPQAPIPTSLPPSLQSLPRPSPPYSQFNPSSCPTKEDTYLECEESTPEDLPGLPPPPPPTEMSTERGTDRYSEVPPGQPSQASKQPPVAPRQGVAKRPIPKPRNPIK